MKTALLLVLLPCFALGRVNEPIETFVARVGRPVAEKSFESGVMGALFNVNGIEVMVFSKRGKIACEIYFNVTASQARGIMAKQPGKFSVDDLGQIINWVDNFTKTSGNFNKDTLQISTDGNEWMKSLRIKDSKAEKPQEKDPSIDKF